MNIFQAITSCYKNGVNFTGRARRAEYWYFMLFTSILTSLYNHFFPTDPFSSIGGILFWIFNLATGVCGIAVTIRRLHDVDRSGWWTLFGCIPIIGTIPMLFWLAMRGTEGDNRYGFDPIVSG